MTGSVSGVNGVKVNQNKEYNNPLATPKDNQVKSFFNNYIDNVDKNEYFDITKEGIQDIKKQIEQTNEKNGVTQTAYDKRSGKATYSDGSTLVYKEGGNNKTSLEYYKKYSDGSLAYGELSTGGTNGSDTDRASWGNSDNKTVLTDGKEKNTSTSKSYVKSANIKDNSQRLYSSFRTINTVEGKSQVNAKTSSHNVNMFNTEN